MPSVGFVYDDVFLDHDTGAHPENGSRMTATMALLEEAGLIARLQRRSVRGASNDELALVHRPAYIEGVRRLASEGGGWVDPDTLVTPKSVDVASMVVGATIAAVDGVLDDELESAYCLVRPPGHHATPGQAMGFCIFNHVAVAGAYAVERRGLSRVAIVDWDVHHGNGTQDAFYTDPRVLYVSTHEYPFYPGTGAAEETGRGDGTGTNVNIPMPHGSGDAEHVAAFAQVVVPALRRFAPELILVSSGFDAHFADDIALQQVSVDGYGALASMVKAAAQELCGGRMVVAQEGGYHLVALPWCVRRTIEVLLGDEPVADPLGTVEPAPPPHFEEMLQQVRKIHGL